MSRELSGGRGIDVLGVGGHAAVTSTLFVCCGRRYRSFFWLVWWCLYTFARGEGKGIVSRWWCWQMRSMVVASTWGWALLYDMSGGGLSCSSVSVCRGR